VVNINGNQSGVILELKNWEQLLIHSENANEIHQARREREEGIS
jgi:hypothetical protein